MENENAFSPRSRVSADTNMANHPERTDEPRRGNGFRPVYGLFRRKWPQYLAEVLVIILGITLSFALDEWKEQDRKRALGQVYLKSLLRDFNEDLESLREVIEETELVVRKARALLALADQPDSVRVDPVRFSADIRDLVRRPLFIAQDATFSDLKSSGNLQLITDFPLKNDLFTYYQHYESIKLVETAEREVTITVVGPYLIKHFSLRGSADARRLSTTQVRIAAILKETEFDNIIFIRLTNREELLGDYREALELGKKIKARLEKNVR